MLLGGCASHVLRPEQSETVPFAMNGRISVKHNGARDSAGLHWTHQAKTDEVLLLTPLGQTAARIWRDAEHATLDDGDRHYRDKDVESLMEQVLGWRLQLDSLHHWVLGMPDARDSLIDRDELGRISVLRQDGWEVRYLNYADNKADSLPSRMQLSRDNVQLMLLIDEWEWNPK